MHSLVLMKNPLLTECTNDKGWNGMWALRGSGRPLQKPRTGNWSEGEGSGRHRRAIRIYL